MKFHQCRIQRSTWKLSTSYFTLLATFCFLHPYAMTRPVEKLPPQDAIKFMRRFGYLDDVGPNAENLYKEDTIVDAIKTVQRFGAIPETGVIDEATQQLFTKRRCGVPDVIRRPTNRTKRFILGGEGWNKRHITYFLANWSPKLYDWHRVMHHLEKAFNKWGEYARLRFSHVVSSEADIVMFFARGPHGDGYPLDGPGNVLAHAFFPYEHDVWGGDIHFDEDEDWTIGPGDGVDFASVAAHEIGHSLGLAHSPVAGSLMFPYYKGHLPNIQLDYDDILAVYELYVSRHIDDDQYWVPDTTERIPTSDDNGGYDRNDGDADDDNGGHDRNDGDADDNNGGHDRNDGDADEDNNGGHDRNDEDADDDNNEDEDKTGGSNTSDEDSIADENVQDDNNDREYDYDKTDNDIDKLFPDNDHDTNDHSDELPQDEDGTTTTTTVSSTTTVTTTTTKAIIVPDLCLGSYDTVTVIRHEMFVFKEEWVWRFQSRWNLAQGYPVPFQHMFHLPTRLPKIDAAYERLEDNTIIFFSGPRFWEFNGNRFIADTPRPLTDLGLPADLDGLDAAFVWAKNKKTYFFRKNQYWRYNETERSMDPTYPQDISRWRGVPTDIDTAMRYTDGHTYFFRGQEYYRFNDQQVKVDDFYPLNAPQDWFGCSPPQDAVQ